MWLCCFWCTWILLPCLYLNNNWEILFVIICCAKKSFYYTTLVLRIILFKGASDISSLRKSKWINFGSVITTSLLYLMFTPIVVLTWLNCCKVFWWFYYANTKDRFCLISFFSLHKLFPAIIWVNNTGSRVNSLCGARILIVFPFFIYFLWPLSRNVGVSSLSSFHLDE